MRFDITKEMELRSQWREPNSKAPLWFWAEIIQDSKTRELSGNTGSLRASTEMEALDRLREAFPEIGWIKWIPKSQY